MLGMSNSVFYSEYVLNKFKSAYIKCVKLFFNFPKYSSVTDMLLATARGS